MDFTSSIKTVYSKYATFKGRASRSEFWWFILYQIIILLLMRIFLILLFLVLLPSFEKQYSVSTYLIAAKTFKFIHFIPITMLTIRRFHDINRSGWWQIPSLLTLFQEIDLSKLNNYVSNIKVMTTGNIYFASLTLYLLLNFAITVFIYGIVLFIWTLLKGTEGPNKYGPDPLVKDSQECSAN